MARTAAVPEKGEVSFMNKAGELKYELVSVNTRDKFILYEVNGVKRKKLGEGQDPKALEEKYSIMEKLS